MKHFSVGKIKQVGVKNPKLKAIKTVPFWFTFEVHH